MTLLMWFKVTPFIDVKTYIAQLAVAILQILFFVTLVRIANIYLHRNVQGHVAFVFERTTLKIVATVTVSFVLIKFVILFLFRIALI